MKLYSGSFILKAKLTKSIEYVRFTETIKLPVGTIILVDTKKNVALFGEDHFSILEHEYTSYYQN